MQLVGGFGGCCGARILQNFGYGSYYGGGYPTADEIKSAIKDSASNLIVAITNPTQTKHIGTAMKEAGFRVAATSERTYHEYEGGNLTLWVRFKRGNGKVVEEKVEGEPAKALKVAHKGATAWGADCGAYGENVAVMKRLAAGYRWCKNCERVN